MHGAQPHNSEPKTKEAELNHGRQIGPHHSYNLHIGHENEISDAHCHFHDFVAMEFDPGAGNLLQSRQFLVLLILLFDFIAMNAKQVVVNKSLHEDHQEQIDNVPPSLAKNRIPQCLPL